MIFAHLGYILILTNSAHNYVCLKLQRSQHTLQSHSRHLSRLYLGVFIQHMYLNAGWFIISLKWSDHYTAATDTQLPQIHSCHRYIIEFINFTMSCRYELFTGCIKWQAALQRDSATLERVKWGYQLNKTARYELVTGCVKRQAACSVIVLR